MEDGLADVLEEALLRLRDRRALAIHERRHLEPTRLLLLALDARVAWKTHGQTSKRATVPCTGRELRSA